MKEDQKESLGNMPNELINKVLWSCYDEILWGLKSYYFENAAELLLELEATHIYVPYLTVAKNTKNSWYCVGFRGKLFALNLRLVNKRFHKYINIIPLQMKNEYCLLHNKNHVAITISYE